ncbi:hypothetical protein [Actinokineospora enzanensis]|nr:hypothetical protein [Actinokineospora enzanensis]
MTQDGTALLDSMVLLNCTVFPDDMVSGATPRSAPDTAPPAQASRERSTR